MSTTTALRPQPETLDGSTWRGRALTPVLVYVGMLVAVVSSLGSPLIPTIASDYGVSLGDAQWTLTVTLLVGALVSPVVGRLGDGPQRRGVLLGALAVVVAGSVLAAVPGLPFAALVTGRGLQGVGLALLPLAMSIARDHLDPDRSRSTLATLSVTTVIGVGLGYPITGLIAEHLSFHAGFWLAAGLGVLAIALVAVVVPRSEHQAALPFDGAGAVLLGLGVAGLVLTISEGEEWGWTSPGLLALGAAAVLFLSVCTWFELRAAHPIVELRQMRDRTVLTANVTGALAGVGMYMLMSMVIRYVQTPTSVSYGLGASVVVSGLVLLPMSAASFSASRLATYLGRFMAPSRILPIGALLFAAALTVFATGRGSLWQICLVMAIGGLGIGCSFSVLPRLIVSTVPADATSSALALNQVLRTVGFAVGSALSATVLTAHTPAASPYPGDAGYTVGALVAIGLCLFTALVSVVLQARSPRTDGQDALLVQENMDAALAGALTAEPDEDDVDAAGRHSAGRALGRHHPDGRHRVVQRASTAGVFHVQVPDAELSLR
ncbi:MFS transporter [Goekera deserti]|uniref:MFS transporter n=1 Tax=Goekera deserti TaxID=2497753 RepID=A0A7K3WED0_9ACTN|nr:MFS transporter [Goekera deserti]NDI46311.1 MFS transporter [Goekera deserti]NEL54757.1 MFS transporter [Goekera deserti]